MNQQNYCFVCGNKLTLKYCDDEGMVKYCDKCDTFRFPLYNSAVSMIVFNPDKDKILLIQQYSRKSNILVAGYINKGETPQQALQRELNEEVGLNAVRWEYNDSRYFEKSQTLIHNFAVVADSENFTLKQNEVDFAQWYSITEAVQYIKPDSLAQKFLLHFLQNKQRRSFL